MYETFTRDLEELKRALITASERRDERAEFNPESGELEWVIHERRVMLGVTNRLRAGRGLRPVEEVAIVRAETSAMGHSDYVQKFALSCAELVRGA